MGSIPATLDMTANLVFKQMSVPINRPNRIHSKSKIIIPLFFSYKRILATKKTFHVIHQFDWEGLYGYVFNTIFRLEQGASF